MHAVRYYSSEGPPQLLYTCTYIHAVMHACSLAAQPTLCSACMHGKEIINITCNSV